MYLQKGNRVLVNVAPFIASLRRNKDSIPCRILSVKETSVEVATEYPYRQISMWISPSWIEELINPDFYRPHENDSTNDKKLEDGDASQPCFTTTGGII